ncbi:hypothetical protein ACGTJS_10935 [Faucicola mancuniensis]|uniref:defense against restriction DarA-related protein n=1 Tax=Faucicola mancuniensis TaxID=1309795 RepID=UPI0039776C61
MQIYQTISPKNTQFSITYPDGSQGTKTARHEIGVITGKYRDIYAVVADTTGFDGLGFDSMIGSADDNWHMVNLFGENHKYIDTVAVNGADDIDHAIHIAMSQFDYLEPQYATFVPNENSVNDDERFDSMGFGADVIQKVLDNPSQNQHFLPIITKKMLTDEQNRASYDDAMWDGINLISHGKNTDNLYMDMLKHDKLGELQERFDLKQALGQLNVSELGFDSLMDTNNRLQLMADRLYTALVKAKIDDLAVNSVELTKPFKRLGMANVAMVFGLSDGQTFTIFFHNPDSDPKKLAPQDVMVSWKWLLNKRDVTAVVSPKNGENLQLSQVAMRMMKIANQNKKRFANAQKKIAKNEQALIDAQKLVDDKKAVVEQLDKDIAELQQQIDDKRNAVNDEPTQVEEPIELSGDEFGYHEYMPIDELREKAINHLETMRDEYVNIPALSVVEKDTQVQLRQRGIEHIKTYSPNPEKLLMLQHIEKLLKTSKYLYKTNNVKTAKKPRVELYYYLTNKFNWQGEPHNCVLVIEKDQQGMLHYDILTGKYAEKHLEQAKKMLGHWMPKNKSGREPSIQGYDNAIPEKNLGNYQNLYDNINLDDNESQADFDGFMFDKASGKTSDMVLNLFIFDENGNEIKDDVVEETTQQEPFNESNTKTETVGQDPQLPTLTDDEIKLNKMLEEQQFMKDVNKIVKSNKSDEEVARLLVEQFGIKQETAMTWATDKHFNGKRRGFEAFRLTNLNNRIKTQQAKVETMRKAEQINYANGENQVIAGVEIELNTDDNRLRLYFPNKPSDEIRTMLKKNGFKWSYNNNAWQRQLTENAMSKAKQVIQAYADDEGIEMEENTPNQTEPTTNPDTDYLNSIINGEIDPLDADMDKIIEIGERLGEEHPLFEQALQMISNAEDVATREL